MPRVSGLPEDQRRDADIDAVFERQRERYGDVLLNHSVLARRPAVFRGFRAMWDGLDASGLLGARLACLVNVRVATRIGCGL